MFGTVMWWVVRQLIWAKYRMNIFPWSKNHGNLAEGLVRVHGGNLRVKRYIPCNNNKNKNPLRLVSPTNNTSNAQHAAKTHCHTQSYQNTSVDVGHTIFWFPAWTRGIFLLPSALGNNESLPKTKCTYAIGYSSWFSSNLLKASRVSYNNNRTP